MTDTRQPRCQHQITLDTDYARMLEVIRCTLCGVRAEVPFHELDGDQYEDASEVLARYARAVFGSESLDGGLVVRCGFCNGTGKVKV